MLTNIFEEADRRWRGTVRVTDGTDVDAGQWEIECPAATTPECCAWLFSEKGFNFGGLVVEEQESAWELRYLWYGDRQDGVIQVITRQPLAEQSFRTLVEKVHAADWCEREAEDLYGLLFEGHPRLGDFVLHNDRWKEDVFPMRRSFDGAVTFPQGQAKRDWHPLLLLEAPGAFAMPVGPIYSGVAESALFLLETQGEDVARCVPRLFYKYRGIEKIAEGKALSHALLLAERCNGTSAFAHGLAFCQAAEKILSLPVPARARKLRVLLAELERFRHHVGAIREICESTGLAVAASQAAILEEELLSLSCSFAGHRYLFGLNAIGGIARDFTNEECIRLMPSIRDLLQRLRNLHKLLRYSNSFLDRIEQVGMVPREHARDFGLVGPIARASGIARDLRRAQPYAGYDEILFEVPSEAEGDGYARLRILFAEAEQSARIMELIAGTLPGGRVRAERISPRQGSALGWVEAPRGAAFHWLRADEEGRVVRYRLIPPSFLNWNGFHLATEHFAFQDFPIIMATFGLSVAENDR